MTEVDLAEIEAQLAVAGWAPQLIRPDSTEFGRTPEQWRPITVATDPETRSAAALALWNRDFLDLIPEFVELLRTHLRDVRAYLAADEPTLVYVAGQGGHRMVWIGRDPRTFDAPAPPFWDSLPEPAQTFQRTVHAAFTAPDRESFGLMHPAHLRTIADIAGRPAGIPGWDDEAAVGEDGRIASNRLLRVTRDAGHLLLCVSPDLPAGQAALVYEGDVDPQDFGPGLDQLMASVFDED